MTDRSDDPGPDPDAFEARLKAARRTAGLEKPEGKTERPDDAMGLGVRVGVELVAALVVGVGIGYLIDDWLGTRPWAMVVFFFLGAGAGVMNVHRAVAGLGMAPGYRRPGGKGGDGH